MKRLPVDPGPPPVGDPPDEIEGHARFDPKADNTDLIDQLRWRYWWYFGQSLEPVDLVQLLSRDELETARFLPEMPERPLDSDLLARAVVSHNAIRLGKKGSKLRRGLQEAVNHLHRGGLMSPKVLRERLKNAGVWGLEVRKGERLILQEGRVVWEKVAEQEDEPASVEFISVATLPAYLRRAKRDADAGGK